MTVSRVEGTDEVGLVFELVGDAMPGDPPSSPMETSTDKVWVFSGTETSMIELDG